MRERYHADLSTTLGPLSVTVDARGRLLALDHRSVSRGEIRDPERCARVLEQLREYFEGRRRRFDLEVEPVGTPFQRRVWRALMEIPYGEVASYGEVAHRIGQPRAARAVGQAAGANPIPIVIPCHRVIAADGSIGGFSSGLDMKRRLLAIEHIRLAA